MDASEGRLPTGRTVSIRADAVRSLRLQKGWSVQELADRANCSVKTIQSVENGKVVFLGTFVKIADALDVPKDTLIG